MLSTVTRKCARRAASQLRNGLFPIHKQHSLRQKSTVSDTLVTGIDSVQMFVDKCEAFVLYKTPIIKNAGPYKFWLSGAAVTAIAWTGWAYYKDRDLTLSSLPNQLVSRGVVSCFVTAPLVATLYMPGMAIICCTLPICALWSLPLVFECATGGVVFVIRCFQTTFEEPVQHDDEGPWNDP